MKLNKLAVAVIAVVTVTLSGCVVVPPRAYVAPPAVYAYPSYGYGDYGHHHRWHRD
jgi:hypothetical protein